MKNKNQKFKSCFESLLKIKNKILKSCFSALLSLSVISCSSNEIKHDPYVLTTVKDLSGHYEVLEGYNKEDFLYYYSPPKEFKDLENNLKHQYFMASVAYESKKVMDMVFKNKLKKNVKVKFLATDTGLIGPHYNMIENKMVLPNDFKKYYILMDKHLERLKNEAKKLNLTNSIDFDFQEYKKMYIEFSINHELQHLYLTELNYFKDSNKNDEMEKMILLIHDEIRADLFAYLIMRDKYIGTVKEKEFIEFINTLSKFRKIEDEINVKLLRNQYFLGILYDHILSGKYNDKKFTKENIGFYEEEALNITQETIIKLMDKN